MALPNEPLLPADFPPFPSPEPAIKIFGKTILPLPRKPKSAIPSHNTDEAKSQSDEDLSPRRIDHRGFSGFSDGSDEDSPIISKVKPDDDAGNYGVAHTGFSSACSYASDEDPWTFSKGKLDKEGKNSAMRIAFSSSASSCVSDKGLPMLVKGKVDDDALASEKGSRYRNINRFCSSGPNYESHEGKVVDDAPLSDKVGRNKEKKSAVGVEEKLLQKPDKPVPCPRCNSMDTKFCYFNNYNINQPRHFCRNCQRYWTAGGTLRNVPVGAGRRKNKHCSQNKTRLQDDRSIIRGDDPVGAQPLFTISQTSAQKSSTMHAPQIEARVLHTTSPAASLVQQEGCFQGNMVVNISGFAGLQTQKQDQAEAEAETGCRRDVMKMCQGAEETTKRKDESGSSVGSCLPAAVSMETDLENRNHVTLSMGTATAAFPFIGMPWPYMHMSWTATGAPAFPTSNPLWPSGSGTPPTSANAPVWIGPAQGFFPWPSLPGAMWSPGWNAPPWGLTCDGANAFAATVPPSSPSVLTKSGVSAVNGPGKRLRPSGEVTDEGFLYVPKSLRIHDPEAVAHSSILTTLGVDGKCGSLASDGIFNAFQPKAEVFQPKSGSKTCEESHTNPDPMSGCMALQESNKLM